MRPPLILLATAALLISCGGDPSAPEPISRELFIDTYVDLRIGAVRSPGRVLPAQTRDSVLISHGVTEAQLLGFVEARGDDLDFMRGVWDEIELRLDAEPEEG